MPPALCESTSAAHLYDAVEPLLRFDLLETARRSDQDAQLISLHGDSLAANKLVITKAAQEAKDVPVVDNLCLGHQISLICDDLGVGAGAGVTNELDIVNPMYATKQLMQQAQPRADVFKAFRKFAEEAFIVRGALPPADMEQHRREVLFSLGFKSV